MQTGCFGLYFRRHDLAGLPKVDRAETSCEMSFVNAAAGMQHVDLDDARSDAEKKRIRNHGRILSYAKEETLLWGFCVACSELHRSK